MHCEDVVLLFSHCSVLFITRVWNQQKVNMGPVELNFTVSVTHESTYVQPAVYNIYEPQKTVQIQYNVSDRNNMPRILTRIE